MRSLEARCAGLQTELIWQGGRGPDKSKFSEISARLDSLRLLVETHQLEYASEAARMPHDISASRSVLDAMRYDMHGISYDMGVLRYTSDWMRHNQELYYAFRGFKSTLYPVPHHWDNLGTSSPLLTPPNYDRAVALAEIQRRHQQSSDKAEQSHPS
ncbi:uncharacterized protein [Rutidosis leptorrhynchoides]|uniref:uncharacterized protein n=1 Tax=Rutidosis leptorrhynchoides TaxID=125765 RepID=UPI003A99181E